MNNEWYEGDYVTDGEREGMVIASDSIGWADGAASPFPMHGTLRRSDADAFERAQLRAYVRGAASERDYPGGQDGATHHAPSMRAIATLERLLTEAPCEATYVEADTTVKEVAELFRITALGTEAEVERAIQAFPEDIQVTLQGLAEVRMLLRNAGTALAAKDATIAELKAHIAAQAASHVAAVEAMMNVNQSRHETVRAFHRRFGHAVADTPAVPDEATVRFRLRLIAEEVEELFDACGYREAVRVLHAGWSEDPEDPFVVLRRVLEEREKPLSPKRRPVSPVNLPLLADALADIDYLTEGFRAVCGIDGRPIHALVHAANMAKEPVMYPTAHCEEPTPDPLAKPTKPEGWAPPDIAAALRAQGWKP